MIYQVTEVLRYMIASMICHEQFFYNSTHHSQHSLIICRKGGYFIRNNIKDCYRLPFFTAYWNSNGRMDGPLQLTESNCALGTSDLASIDDSPALKSPEAQTLDIFARRNSSHTYLVW